MTEKLGGKRNPLTRFDPKIHVLLEGTTDHAILSRLLEGLEGLENILFKSADGCKQVKDIVERNIGREDSDGEVVFGIVDRDVLFTESASLDDFLEPDDEAFKKKQHFGPTIGHRVRVLLRWELENYLILDPDTIGRYAKDCRVPNAPLSDKYLSDMLRTLIELGDSQVPLIALCARACLKGEAHPVSLTTHALHERARQGTEREAREKLGPEIDACSQWQALMTRIDAVHAGSQLESRDRWKAMNRLVDGKRILNQLRDKLPLNTFRSQLATQQAGRKTVVAELVFILNEFKRESQRIAAATRS